MTLRRASLVLSLVALAAFLTASASASQASSVPVDPAAIAFDVSADHDAETFIGPKVLEYVIEFVPVVGAPGTTYEIKLGKPKPVNGQITVPLSKVLLSGTYMAHVRAIGPGLKSSPTSTTGPFIITEKTAKTKAEYDKEMRARQNKKVKVPKTTPVPPEAKPEKDGKDGTKEDSKPGSKSRWKKFYEKVVG
jgi:hypothetical protein